ncbi:hypothetical protein [Micromonospora sp. NPDC049497]|uniref:hypothetical protein n=1 Tax=Micromonospora sp. NPDC049497 TaxID=3364273 RepID=UPI0037B5D697
MWLFALAGALLVGLGLFTLGKATYIDAHGVTGRAEVVASTGGRTAFVRVRLASGRETNLWAWTGTPAPGTTIEVVHVEERNWTRDARVFAPAWKLWLDFGLGLGFLAGAQVERVRRARREARSD